MVKKVICILLILVLLSACQSAVGDNQKNRQEPLGAGQINRAIEIAPLEPIGEETLPEIAPLEPIREGTLPEIAPLEPIREGTLPEIAPLEPIREGTLPEIAPLEPIKDEPAQTEPTQVPKPSSKPMNADWILNVDDNAIQTLEGMKYHVNLYVSMSKSGGTELE